VVVRALVSADRVAAWNAVNQVVADEDLYREAHAIATRLSRLGGIDVHRTIAGSFEE
jgi:enoyl-CoA hydratase/carnithine racemase